MSQPAEMSQPAVVRAHEVADRLFDEDQAVFGVDLPVYRGHVHRVIGLVGAQTPLPDDRSEALGLAAFFHDAGIWFDGTWDYLPPSIRRARAALGDQARTHGDLVAALIDEHHRIRRARHPDPLVEAFRRADLTDVSGGLVPSPGVAPGTYRSLVAQYPAHGFRPMLLRAFGRGLHEAPLHPLPMMKI